MEIKRIEINGKTFRMFYLKIKGEYMNVAEEALDDYILEQVENEQYDKVKHIDEQYGYYVPQEVADTENEDDIRESIEDEIDDDEWINKYQAD